MIKWIILIIVALYIIGRIRNFKKSENKRLYIDTITKEQKIVDIVIVIAFVGYIIYLISQPIIFNTRIRKVIKKSEIYQYVNSYNISGYKNSIIELNINDDFKKLDDKDKLKITKKLYNEVDFEILRYGNKDWSDSQLLQLVQNEKIIINSTEGEYKYSGHKLKKPNGEEIEEENTNINTSTDTVNINNSETNLNMPILDEKKGELLAVAKDIVKSHLKSPKSADFKWGFDNYTFERCKSTTPGYDGYIVSGQVEAVNSFNVELENTFIVQFEMCGDKYRVVDCTIL